MKRTKIILVLFVIGILTNCTRDDNLDSIRFNNIALSGDTYSDIEENPFIQASAQPVSTFSIDADGASYANVRRFIQQDNQLPPKGAVRTEELINCFSLDYDYTDDTHPINTNGEVSQCPWNTSNKLIRIGIKG